MLKFLNKINFKIIFWVFFYLFIFTFLLHNSFNYLDPDLGWHLKVGQTISETHQVPHYNHYDYTFKGQWVDHEWLSNLGLYFLYEHGAYLTLNIVFSLIVVFILILLNILVHNFWPKISPFPIILFESLGLLASLPHFGARVQVLGPFFLLLFLIILIYYNKNKNWKILLFLPPLMYLWACLHASFLIAFFLALAWLVIKIIERFIYKSKFKFKSKLDFSGLLKVKEIIIFSSFLLFSFIATLFTPYYLNLYSFLLGYKDAYYQTHIQEWLSQFYFPLQYWQLLYLALVVLALIFYIYYTREEKKYFKINLWILFLVLLFVFLSFKSRRHFPLMFVVSFLFLIDVWRNVFGIDFGAKSENNKWPNNKWLQAYLIFSLILVSTYQIIQTKFINRPFNNNFCQEYPCKAVKFLKNNHEYDSLRIFNSYGWGGYLIWVYPQRKLFIDGRLPQVVFRGKTFLEDYDNFFKKNENLKKDFKEYNIKLILLPSNDNTLKLKKWEKFIFNIKDKDLINHNYLKDYLSASSNWKIIYKDKTAIIYSKLN